MNKIMIAFKQIDETQTPYMSVNGYGGSFHLPIRTFMFADLRGRVFDGLDLSKVEELQPIPPRCAIKAQVGPKVRHFPLAPAILWLKKEISPSSKKPLSPLFTHFTSFFS